MEITLKLSVNQNNKAFIDEFMDKHYQRLHDKFRLSDKKINGQGNSSLDILNDIVIGLYTRVEDFRDRNLAFRFMHDKFRGQLLVPSMAYRKLRKADLATSYGMPDAA